MFELAFGALGLGLLIYLAVFVVGWAIVMPFAAVLAAVVKVYDRLRYGKRPALPVPGAPPRRGAFYIPALHKGR